MRGVFPPPSQTHSPTRRVAGKQSWCNHFGFQPFQCVVSFRQERVVFFEAHKKSPHLALDYILTPSSKDIT